MSFVYLGPITIASGVMTAIACYKSCRFLTTVALKETKSLAYEVGVLVATMFVLAVACAVLALFGAL